MYLVCLGDVLYGFAHFCNDFDLDFQMEDPRRKREADLQKVILQVSIYAVMGRNLS